MADKDKDFYISMLCDIAQKEGRLPKKSDFSEYDVMRIKGFFGPWPWALEAAGLKEPKHLQKAQKNREKRLAKKDKRSV
ncbi:MAG: homing endonuclease associated repeat-containing protein [Acutalibacteraceae bacterium]